MTDNSAVIAKYADKIEKLVREATGKASSEPKSASLRRLADALSGGKPGTIADLLAYYATLQFTANALILAAAESLVEQLPDANSHQTAFMIVGTTASAIRYVAANSCVMPTIEADDKLSVAAKVASLSLMCGVEKKHFIKDGDEHLPKN